MKRTALDTYDMEFIPREMKAYLRNYGYSFSKKACEFAVGKMRKKNPTSGKKEKIEAWSKDDVDTLMKKYGVELENNIGYNYVYIANMLKADMFKSSIPDEQHLALGVKDIIDDVDSNPENIFRKWLVCMDGDGEPIEWDEII